MVETTAPQAQPRRPDRRPENQPDDYQRGPSGAERPSDQEAAEADRQHRESDPHLRLELRTWQGVKAPAMTLGAGHRRYSRSGNRTKLVRPRSRLSDRLGPVDSERL